MVRVSFSPPSMLLREGVAVAIEGVVVFPTVAAQQEVVVQEVVDREVALVVARRRNHARFAAKADMKRFVAGTDGMKAIRLKMRRVPTMWHHMALIQIGTRTAVRRIMSRLSSRS